MKQQQPSRVPVRRINQRRAAGRPVVESLESRQLMHAVVDLRVAGGGSNEVTVATVGQTINFEVWVKITGHDGQDNEGLRILSGAFLSSNITGGAATGTITITRDDDFDSTGSSDGAQNDLDSDGDLDVGGPVESDATGFFAGRGDDMITNGTRSGESEEFRIATGTFTVTGLLPGVQTELTFKGRPSVGSSLVFREDGVDGSLATGGSIAAGNKIVLKREAIGSISGRVFDDKNATGLFDEGDTGVSGFRVYLDKDFDGVLDPDEVSKPVSGTGTFTFSNVAPGRYFVRQVARDGWRTTYPDYHDTTIAYGQQLKSRTFANTQGVLIKGTVWNDSNANKAIDGVEDRLRWRVIIDLNKNGIWDGEDVSKVTNGSGKYRFSLLTNGEFHVFAFPAEGWRITTNGGAPRIITLGPGGTTSNKNFGLKRLK